MQVTHIVSVLTSISPSVLTSLCKPKLPRNTPEGGTRQRREDHHENHKTRRAKQHRKSSAVSPRMGAGCWWVFLRPLTAACRWLLLDGCSSKVPLK